tara:strand:- start:279 stop:1058 length:780 start_codon:yes stop_codon:yes gene_type:complete
MYGRDSDTNKNVPIEFIQGEGMLIKDADIISAVDGVNSTLQGMLQVEDSTANGYLSNIESAVQGTLLVDDMTAQGILTNIENSLTSTLMVEDSIAAGTLSNIEMNQAAQSTAVLQNAGNASLVSIDAILAGTLAVSDSIAQGTLSSIDSALAGTITTSSGVSRTNGNLAVAASVTSGGVSASVDCNNFKRFAIFGNLGASGEVIVQWSNDNSAWYDSQHQFWSNASAYDFSGSAEADARYIRVKYGVTGTVTARYALSA